MGIEHCCSECGESVGAEGYCEAHPHATVDSLLVGTVRLVVDEEYNAEEWWDAARRGISGCPEALRSWVQDCTGADATCSAADALAFRTWARTLPGWDDGPAHARHPVLEYPAD